MEQRLIKKSRFGWVWALGVILLTYAAALALVLEMPQEYKNVVLVPFFALAPGMAVTLALRLDEMFPPVPVAFMLSLSVAVVVALVLLYLGLWRFNLGVPLLMGISLTGAILRLLQGLLHYLRRRK